MHNEELEHGDFMASTKVFQWTDDKGDLLNLKKLGALRQLAQTQSPADVARMPKIAEEGSVLH